MEDGQAVRPGWYPDEDGLQRWWDGSGWTDTLDFEPRPGDPRATRLTMTEDEVSWLGTTHRWADVDRIRYSSTEQRVNGAYMGTNFAFEIGVPHAKALIFMLRSGTGGPLGLRTDTEKRDAYRAVWSRAVEIIDARVGRRLVDNVVRTVRQGGSIEFAGLRLDSQGVHKGGLFKKSIPWIEVAGTRVENLEVAVLARKGAKLKPGLKVMRNRWNVVYLPSVIAALGR